MITQLPVPACLKIFGIVIEFGVLVEIGAAEIEVGRHMLPADALVDHQSAFRAPIGIGGIGIDHLPGWLAQQIVIVRIGVTDIGLEGIARCRQDVLAQQRSEHDPDRRDITACVH